jgi:hypothetical protein
LDQASRAIASVASPTSLSCEHGGDGCGDGELLRLGREALRVADWERARTLFEQAAAFGESAEVLDGVGEALQFGGEHRRAIELKERAFAEYERRGSRAEAVGLARWLAFLHVSVHGNVAAANGWMARAEGLLEGSRSVLRTGG